MREKFEQEFSELDFVGPAFRRARQIQAHARLKASATNASIMEMIRRAEVVEAYGTEENHEPEFLGRS